MFLRAIAQRLAPLALLAVLTALTGCGDETAGPEPADSGGDASATPTDATASAEADASAVDDEAAADEDVSDAPAPLCEVVPASALTDVFGKQVPEVDDRSFGPEFQECLWEIEDGPELSAVLISRADFTEEFLDQSGKPRAKAKGIENGEYHEGVLGIARFNTRGSSLYYTVGDVGGVVSVRTGEDSDFATDDPIALEVTDAIVHAYG